MPNKETLLSKSNKKGASNAEKAGRIYRDFNILGAIALGGAAIIAPPALAAPAAVLAGINVLQAGGGEWLRRHGKQKRLAKQPKR